MEERLEGGEEVSHMAIWAKNFPGIWSGGANVLRQEHACRVEGIQQMLAWTASK